jgi:hypothetical protein
MSWRRALVLGVQLYLTVDYCSPWLPGAFSFACEPLFIESVEARARPEAAPTDVMRPVRNGQTLGAITTAPAPLSPRPAGVPHQYSLPRARVAAAQPPPPGGLPDH